MKVEENKPYRAFRPNKDKEDELFDCGRIKLEADEQVTMISLAGKEHDFVAKSWGFFSTPSVNKRLRDKGFKVAMVRGLYHHRIYILTIDTDHISEFLEYLNTEDFELLEWLDERPARW